MHPEFGDNRPYDWNKDITSVLVWRDGLAPEEAEARVIIAVKMMLAGRAPEEVVASEFGLGPEYAAELFGGLK